MSRKRDGKREIRQNHEGHQGREGHEGGGQRKRKAGIERIMMQHLLHDDLEALALIGQEVIPEAANL